MRQWMVDALKFLFWLLVLHLARWAVMLFCAIEVLGVLILWAFAFVEGQIHNQMLYLLIPI